MIDPTKITNFKRTEAQLQEFLLFCIVVAGKSSFQQAKKLEEFLNFGGDEYKPFEKVRFLHAVVRLIPRLREVKMGQYNRISKAFRSVVKYKGSLKKITLEELEPMVGMKTARFFLVHSRPNQTLAVLDRHILAEMRAWGYDVPKDTPTSTKRYHDIEKCYLRCLERMGITNVAEFDLNVWKNRARKTIA